MSEQHCERCGLPLEDPAELTHECPPGFTETQRSLSGARSDEKGEVGVPAEPALTRVREEFELVAKLGTRADIDSAMLVVRAALAHRPALTDREAFEKHFGARSARCWARWRCSSGSVGISRLGSLAEAPETDMEQETLL